MEAVDYSPLKVTYYAHFQIHPFSVHPGLQPHTTFYPKNLIDIQKTNSVLCLQPPARRDFI